MITLGDFWGLFSDFFQSHLRFYTELRARWMRSRYLIISQVLGIGFVEDPIM